MGASAPFEALNVTVSEAGSALGRDHEGANWRPRRRRTLAVKRAMDVIGAAFGLVLFSPLLLMVGVWIVVVDDNSPIFRQERVGLGGRRFVIYKFRTVYTRFCDPTGRTIFGPADNRLLPRVASCAAHASTSCRSCSTSCAEKCRWLGPDRILRICWSKGGITPASRQAMTSAPTCCRG